MIMKILFQSVDRIEGKEARSKFLHNDSKLYKFLHCLKELIAEKYSHKRDYMDLHIEITKDKHDPQFNDKARSLRDKEIDLSDAQTWGYLGRAFVLWTPKVVDYGKTHITICYFGNHPLPELHVLCGIINNLMNKFE